MNETGIIWTEATWNPLSGCQKISAGCKYCYASTLAENKRGTLAFPNGFDLTIRPHKLKEPFKLKKPSLIFVNSMSDLFWDKIPKDYLDNIIDVIANTPQHQYQVLTKRPERMLAYNKERSFPSNFWAGVTIENNESLIKRLPILKQVKSRIKFISFEPLLEDLKELNLKGINWVITGGESGQHLSNVNNLKTRSLVVKVETSTRTANEKIPWVRNIKNICIRDNVNFFHKQWGGPTPKSGGRSLDGREWSEYPE